MKIKISNKYKKILKHIFIFSECPKCKSTIYKIIHENESYCLMVGLKLKNENLHQHYYCGRCKFEKIFTIKKDNFWQNYFRDKFSKQLEADINQNEVEKIRFDDEEYINQYN